MAPNVGRNAVTPHRAAGKEMEPAVSDPMANGTMPAEVEAAGPADEPVENSSMFQGFLVLPPNQMSSYANDPATSLATRTAPADLNFL
ncbi:hypothetical protein TIFTF001_031285 [Ficus carica]|uniref:Uncharacterized protein n=1 Tax=Ficus carica TaxID=3494 RepID=A0AA88DUS4_FICCA|nr:hypothetical protein TIFTF001_031285 [Ficus carica]